MSSPYRPSPFANHPTVVMAEKKSETPEAEQPRRKRHLRYALCLALALSIAYAVWMWTR